MKEFPCFIFHCVQGIKLVLSSYYTMATHAYYQPLHQQNIMKHITLLHSNIIESYLYIVFKTMYYVLTFDATLGWGQNTPSRLSHIQPEHFLIFLLPPCFTEYLWAISVLFSLYLLKEAGKKINRPHINKIFSWFCVYTSV